LGILDIFYPTGDEIADLAKIQQYYKGIHARFPEKYHLSDL
jgi:hypothetical protein